MEITDVVNNVRVFGLEDSIKAAKYPMSVDISALTYELTPGIKKLGNAKTGSGHDNFLKGIVVQFDLTFTPKMSVELERYHFIDFVSSQSTMHKITKFDLDSAYIEYVDRVMVNRMKGLIERYNAMTKEQQNSEEGKKLYLKILYSNPCGMFLTARMTTNYQQLVTIYHQRRHHRLPEWQVFCDWIETLPHFKELCLTNK